MKKSTDFGNCFFWSVVSLFFALSFQLFPIYADTIPKNQKEFIRQQLQESNTLLSSLEVELNNKQLLYNQLLQSQTKLEQTIISQNNILSKQEKELLVLQVLINKQQLKFRTLTQSLRKLEQQTAPQLQSLSDFEKSTKKLKTELTTYRIVTVIEGVIVISAVTWAIVESIK